MPPHTTYGHSFIHTSVTAQSVTPVSSLAKWSDAQLLPSADCMSSYSDCLSAPCVCGHSAALAAPARACAQRALREVEANCGRREQEDERHLLADKSVTSASLAFCQGEAAVQQCSDISTIR